MKRLMVAVALFAATARAQTRGAVDWIFLVDTSASMRGAGGTKNIFGDVKQGIETFIQEAHDGDSVSIFTFDKDVKLLASADIQVPSDRDELRALVEQIGADGKRTHLGLAIQRGLERSEARMSRGDPTRERAIVLFTDGKEDVKGIKHPVPIADNLDRVSKSHPWMFFVSMGEHEQQLDQFPNARILKPQDAASIADAVRTIRQTVQPPAPPPAKPRVHQPPPPAPEPWTLGRILKWAGGLGFLLLLIAIAALLYSGKSPDEAWAAITERNTLEGELEIVAPRVAADAAFVGLPRLRMKDVALSTILPLDALAGSDARLFCRRRNGEKKIWISADQGSLRVNDIEVPMTELYDADTIRIGDATLRFNRVGHERPALQEDLA